MPIDKSLDARLRELEAEQDRQEHAVHDLAKITELKDVEDIKISKEIKQGGKGFYICLDFGAGAPVSEWSEETNGWRSKNQGTRYKSQAEAEQRYKQLKQKWPDYPLKIRF